MSTVDVTSSPERNEEGEISKKSPNSAWSAAQLCQALPGALRKLNPRDQFHNPVMALVWVGAVLTTILAIIEALTKDSQISSEASVPGSFVWIVAGWLWLTVIFANLAESVAEGRGKAQAETLRRTRTTTVAHRVVNYDASNDPAALEAATTEVSSGDLALSDVVVVVAGQTIPGDGDVIAGIASIDESAITGESAPVVRESGGDRSAVTGGTRVLSDRIVVRITSKPGQTFVDRMIALVEGSARQKTPNEIALNILLASLSIVFVIVALARKQGFADGEVGGAVVPFTAQTRMSGLDLPDGTNIRKGAASAVLAWLEEVNGEPLDTQLSTELDTRVQAVSNSGGTPLVVAVRRPGGRGGALGIVHLKDIVKEGLTERFEELRRMGIRTVMVTGDNALTAAAIAKEAGVDDFIAEATPEDKLAYIKAEQEGGRLVAMTGDGTNDAPALAQADVGVAMNTGTSAAKEAGNMVDLDSDPTKLIDIVAIGKQVLITRGALTTFSIANDIAKYFAIIPAMFMGIHPGLSKLNVMGLHSSSSAVLSAVIFNALVIIALVPLALKGVRYRAVSAAQALRRNLTIYGVGGIIVPFVGIWLIDLLVRLIPGF